MASLVKDNDGRRILFSLGPREKGRCVRLGSTNEKQASFLLLQVERLVAARHTGSIDPSTQAWVAGIDDRLHEKLSRVGLVEPREHSKTRLGQVLDAYLAASDVKPATKVRIEQASRSLREFFGESRDATTLKPTDADAWRAKLKADGYAPATISRTVLYARQFFRWAISRGMAQDNPFSQLRAGPQTNPSRRVFIDRATIAKVIDAAPDAEWRLLIVLSRFGGLRVPSEALSLLWSDVDWEHNRITVRSVKTEHHEGGGERIIPIFPEVRGHLMAVFENAPEGTESVITRYRTGANLNPHFRRIIRRAGLVPWTRTWHNLRASRQTELAATFPLHTVCAWIGNTKAVAQGHYLQVTDADWARATEAVPSRETGSNSGAQPAQIPAQHRNELRRTEPQPSP